MKTKIAAVLVAALMVLAVLPAGAHDLPDIYLTGVASDGDPDNGDESYWGLRVGDDGNETIQYAPRTLMVDGKRASELVRFFAVEGANIDHHDRHAGGTDDCNLWLGGFPGWTGNGLPGWKAHDPAAAAFGLANVADDPSTDEDEAYDASATWEGLSHPRTTDWCYEGYVAGQRTATTPSVSSATRGGVAQERETARHGNPSAYKTFYCSDGVEQRRGAPATGGCLILDGGKWTAGASVQYVTGSYRGFVYRLS